MSCVSSSLVRRSSSKKAAAPAAAAYGATADVWALSDDRGRFILRDNEKTEIVAERLLQPLFGI